jgi:uncharacterized protein (TIGR00725 family)
MKKLQIAVIGSAGYEEYPFSKPVQSMFAAAEQIGKMLAEAGCVVVNGGKGGVMEGVCKGAQSAGGITVAEIAGNGRGESNQFVDIEIVTTDVGFRGPSILIGMSDAVIALGGGAGTLQEIAVAYRMQKPIVLLQGYGGWVDKLTDEFLDERQLRPFYKAVSVKDAVRQVVDEAKKEIRK